jgi:glutamate dehydrogenase (NAD(P)+)
VVEGANGPTTAAADAVLAARDVMVVPDILANAGGVIVSYFEWVQGLQAMAWSGREVADRLEQRLAVALDAVVACAGVHDVDLRTGALCLAVQRVVDAHRVRGLYP